MTFSELEDQVSKIESGLSAEGRMLVDLFMPFCRALSSEIKELSLENKQLKDRLAKNSSNSSKPPSQDILRSPKKRSLRESSGRQPGGQQGHPGQGGKLRDDPDEIVKYSVASCPNCAQDLRSEPVYGLIRKQIEELPAIRTMVTEYQIEVKKCPCCNEQCKAEGCEVHHEFQYGPRVKALSVYLSAYQFLPVQRTKELLSLLGLNLSSGTLDNFRKSASVSLSPFIELLRKSIIDSDAGFFDETGIKVSGKNNWIHVAATKLYTLFLLHPKRGKEAHEAMAVLPFFKGVLHRDGYRSYNGYLDAILSLCCAHLLRELKFTIDHDAQKNWATPLISLLIEIKGKVEKSSTLDLRWQADYRKRYRELIAMGLSQNPKRPPGPKRGRTAQSKTYNLLTRLQVNEDEVLRFMTHTHAQFDNNQAERDLRMNKVRAKISGGFRSFRAGEEFMRVRSFVATAVKQGHNPIESLVQLFTPGNTQYMKLADYPE
jgi:transposase